MFTLWLTGWMIKMINMYEWTKMNDAKKAYGCSNSCWKCSIQLWIGIWHCSISYNKNALIVPSQHDAAKWYYKIKTVLYQWTGRGYIILSIYSRDIGNICSYHTSSAARFSTYHALHQILCKRTSWMLPQISIRMTIFYPLPMSFKIEMCTNW